MAGKAGARVGRPTADEAAAIDDRLLRCVWELYVNGGYSNISYDVVAATERMSKRTIYARHHSKEALFRAAVSWRIERWIAENRLSIDSHFEDPVWAFVELSMAALLTPDAVAMGRILRGEDGRFPDLADVARQGLHVAVKRLAALLKPSGVIEDENAQETARCIVDMLAGRAMSIGSIARDEDRAACLAAQLPSILRVVDRLRLLDDTNALPPSGGTFSARIGSERR